MIPSVSVVMAAYNYDRFVAGAIESALGQTFADFELIVVNDGSSDDTEAVVRPYLRDPRVSYIKTGHLGQPRAKNAGVRLCRAPLVAFLDADDCWEPTKVERQLTLFRADPDLGVVYTRRRLMDEDGAELRYDQPPLYRGRVVDAMFRDNFVCFSSCMVRREVFDDVGLFDETIPMAIDYDLWLRVALRYRFDYVDEPLVRYRVGHANLSRRVDERLEIALQIMKRFLDDRGGREALDKQVVSLAFAETYSNGALLRRHRTRLGAFAWYIRALASSPVYYEAWRGLASLPIPESGRRALRRALGRPVNWRERHRLPVAAALPATESRHQ